MSNFNNKSFDLSPEEYLNSFYSAYSSDSRSRPSERPLERTRSYPSLFPTHTSTGSPVRQYEDQEFSDSLSDHESSIDDSGAPEGVPVSENSRLVQTILDDSSVYSSNSVPQPDPTVSTVDTDVDFSIAIEDPSVDDDAVEAAIFQPPLNEYSSSPKHRCFFITHFAEDWTPPFDSWHLVDFAVYTKEITPTTNRVHYHAYVEFSDKVEYRTVQNKLHCPKANIQPRKGTQKQAIQYCMKLRTRFPGFETVFYGLKKRQGQRSDLDWLNEAIAQGATKRELLQIGGGNVLRYLNMINIAQRVYNSQDQQDLITLARRRQAANLRLPISSVVAPQYEDIKSEVEDYRNLSLDIASNFARSTALDHALSMVASSDLDKAERLEAAKKQKAEERSQRKAAASAAPSRQLAKQKQLTPPEFIATLVTKNPYKRFSDAFIKRTVAAAEKHLDVYLKYYYSSPFNSDIVFSRVDHSMDHVHTVLEAYFYHFIKLSFADPVDPNPVISTIFDQMSDTFIQDIYEEYYDSFYGPKESISADPSEQ